MQKIALLQQCEKVVGSFNRNGRPEGRPANFNLRYSYRASLIQL